MEDGKVVGLLALAAGIALGVNWPKIKRYLPKLRKQAKNLKGSAKEAVREVAKSVLPQQQKRVAAQKQASGTIAT